LPADKERDVNEAIFLPTAVLFAGAALEIVLGGVLSRTAKGWLAVAIALAALAAACPLLPAVSNGQGLAATLADWDAGVALAYRVDGLSVLFMLMGTGIGAAILLYSVRYMEHEEQGVTRFYALMLVFIGGLVLLVCSANMLVLYFAWELIGLCSYFLVSFWYRTQAAADGARKVLIITHFAGYGLFAAILVLHARTGSWLWTDPAAAGAFSAGVVILMLIAAMAKSVMYPLHSWIPEAMNAPTPVSALLHSACYVKAGVFLVARMYSIGPWHETGGKFLLVVGCATMLVGVVFALAQTDLKRLLAFHTVSQLGYIVTGLSLGTGLGVAAGLYYIVSHALFKGTLFMCAGAVQHATGTRDLRQLGGLYARMPRTTLIWIVAAASISGVPLTTGLVAKWLVFDAALEAGQAVVLLVGWVASLLTAFSFLKATVSAFFGSPAPEMRARQVHEVPVSMQLGMGVLAFLCLAFGVAPQLLLDPVIAPAVRSLGFAWDVQPTWFGVATASGAVGVTVGAGLVMTAALLGAGAYRLLRVSIARPVAVFSGGEPLSAGGTLGATDFAEMAEHAFKPVYSLDPDPFYLRIWATIRDSSAAVGRFAATRLERSPIAVGVICAAALWTLVWLL
jgi:multicomponent Na+:H+ antiporter subunit A